VEFQGHAGPAVTRRVLELCLEAGCRLAGPGEFTLRAFLGGRISLDQAEAVAQLVAAQSQVEARLALGALAGGLARRLAPVRAALVRAAAAVEAAVDFPDEVEEIAGAELARILEQEVIAPLGDILQARERKRVFREGGVVVLCGRPNVGKSSLFNALLQEDRAIVTPRPGTTRDAIEEAALIGGVVCRLVDTAGLADTTDEVEALGVQLAQERLSRADLALVVLDRSQPLTPGDRQVLAATSDMPRVVAANKADLPPAWAVAQEVPEAVEVSARTAEGLEALRGAIGRALTGGLPEPAPGEVVVGARQAGALARCKRATARAARGLAVPGSEVQPELVSLELSEALAALGEVDGQGAPEEVIAAVFDQFCVGK
jgi:tRNA modification GTPase